MAPWLYDILMPKDNGANLKRPRSYMDMRSAVMSGLQGPKYYLVAIVLIAFIAGGGGVGAAISNLAVQGAALIVLFANFSAVTQFCREAPRWLLLLVGCSMALPLVQIIPLPPSIWTHLPGRDLVVQSLQLIGQDERWAPLSIAPARTFIAFLGLVPPFTVLILSWQLSPSERRMIIPLLLCLGACSVIIGAIQLISGGTAAMIQVEAYGSPDLHGFFANRNSSGLFFVITLIALVVWSFSERRRRSSLLIAATTALLLLLCLVLTRSRSSMALGILILPVLGYALFNKSMQTQKSLLVAGVLGAGVLVAGIFVLSALGNSQVKSSIDRFTSIEDVRPLIWQDTLSAIKRYGVIGSGMGTFDEVFQVDESLEYLDPLRAGRAHNDWLEIALEAGVAGVLLALGWTGWILSAGVIALKRRNAVIPVGAFAILACMALQSILDYPLRNEALLCTAALALALLRPIDMAKELGGGV